MKHTKIFKTLLLTTAIIVSFKTVDAFAKSTSFREHSPCHTFTGYLNGYESYGAASTNIENGVSKQVYAYIEAISSNGYRLRAADKFGTNRAYTSVRVNRPSVYQSRHTVKDPNCKNKYLRLYI